MDDRDFKTYYTGGGSGITAPVTIPLLQSVITGAFAGIAAGVVCAVLQLGFSAWAAGAVVWVLVTFGSWLSFRGHWQAVIERALGVDFNGDGIIGEPEPALPEPQPLRVELYQDNGARGEFIDLPYSDRLPALASGLLAGRQFAQTAWTGGGQLFSRAEFEELRAAMLKRGLARWKNPQAPAQGIEITPAGRAVLRRVAGRDSPSPTDQGGV